MNKRLMSSVLAGAMAVSALGVSASAATSTTKNVTAAGSTTFKVSATVAEAIIDVTIPSSVSAVVNPYGISVTTKTGVYGEEGFTSPIYTIKNNTITSAVKVSVTPTITVPTTSVKDPDTKVTTKVPTITVAKTEDEVKDNEELAKPVKSIYAYVAGASADATVAAATEAPANLDFTGTPATYAEDGEEETEPAAPAQSAVYQAVFEDATTDIKGAQHTKYDIMVIPKAAGTVTNGTASVTQYGYGQFVMGGAVTDTNKTAWTKSDKININLVIDIAPCADGAELKKYGVETDEEEEGGITLDTSAATFDGVTITGTTGTVALDMSDTGEASFTALKDDAGNIYKKTGTYTVAVKENADNVDVTIATAGKVTFGATGTDGEYTVVLTFTDSSDAENVKTLDVTFTVTESGN